MCNVQSNEIQVSFGFTKLLAYRISYTYFPPNTKHVSLTVYALTDRNIRNIVVGHFV